MLSGTFSGLNLGLMSLTEDDLNVVIQGSTDPKEVRWAKKILPVRKRGNLLLCTLLVGNTLVNVMLAILTDPIWTWMFGPGTLGTVFALAVPTALIVIFGEIIPQAYCGRNALFIGGARPAPSSAMGSVAAGGRAGPSRGALATVAQRSRCRWCDSSWW